MTSLVGLHFDPDPGGAVLDSIAIVLSVVVLAELRLCLCDDGGRTSWICGDGSNISSFGGGGWSTSELQELAVGNLMLALSSSSPSVIRSEMESWLDVVEMGRGGLLVPATTTFFSDAIILALLLLFRNYFFVYLLQLFGK